MTLDNNEMSKDKYNNDNLDEDWKSYNAQKCIENYEYPIPYFTKFNISKFLSAYQKAYPSKVDEYIFLSKLKVADWKFCAKKYRCSSWHHFGPTAQRTGFWDLWALADELLLRCKTNNGSYQYQLLLDYIASARSQSRQHINKLNSQNQVRLCTIKFLSSAGIIYAPCIIKERWGKTRKQDIIYFDYILVCDYCETDTPTLLNTEDIQTLDGFCIINTFKNYNDKVFSKFSKFYKSSFYKLLDYAEANNLSISTLGEDLRPKLEYKGPPKP